MDTCTIVGAQKYGEVDGYQTRIDVRSSLQLTLYRFHLDRAGENIPIDG